MAYELRSGIPYYGVYNTWHEEETIDWYQFQTLGEGNYFGVFDLYAIAPISDPVPEPAAAPLLAGALACFCLARRRKR